MKKNIFSISVLFLLFLFTTACTQQEKPLLIAVSHLSGNPEESSYIQWLKSAEPELNYFVMNKLPPDSVEIVFDLCSGLLLTGGEDIDPARYGQADDTVKCGTINSDRDSLEFLLIELALARKTPVLGICRGQQILNVAMGGSLIVDIPTELQSLVYHRCDGWQNCFHDVNVLGNNLLSEISGIESGTVTTNHHQAVKRLAKPFKVLATSTDGVIESVGWKEPGTKPWLLAVQWHPERMDSTNMLSRPLAKNFLKQAMINHKD
jgi:putative glutamine amidotransferase